MPSVVRTPGIHRRNMGRNLAWLLVALVLLWSAANTLCIEAPLVISCSGGGYFANTLSLREANVAVQQIAATRVGAPVGATGGVTAAPARPLPPMGSGVHTVAAAAAAPWTAPAVLPKEPFMYDAFARIVPDAATPVATALSPVAAAVPVISAATGGTHALPPPTQCVARAQGLMGYHLTSPDVQYVHPDSVELRRGCGAGMPPPPPASPAAAAAASYVLFEPVLSGWCGEQPRASNSFANYQMAFLVGLLTGRTVVMPPYWAPNPSSGGVRATRPYPGVGQHTGSGYSYSHPERAAFGTGAHSAWDPFHPTNTLEGLFDIDAARRCARGATQPAQRPVGRTVISWTEFSALVEDMSDTLLSGLFAGSQMVCGRTDASVLCGCGTNGNTANATGSNPVLLLSARVRAAASGMTCDAFVHVPNVGDGQRQHNDFLLKPREL